MRFQLGLFPDTAAGAHESRHSPGPFVGWGGDISPHIPPHSLILPPSLLGTRCLHLTGTAPRNIFSRTVLVYRQYISLNHIIYKYLINLSEAKVVIIANPTCLDCFSTIKTTMCVYQHPVTTADEKPTNRHVTLTHSARCHTASNASYTVRPFHSSKQFSRL